MTLSRSQTPFLVATNVLTSWLDHLKIPCTMTSEETVRVGDLNFRLFDSKKREAPEWSDRVVDVRALASSNPTTSLAALHSMTAAAGFGAPNPMRCQGKPRRQQQAGLSALRLAEYAQAPDLRPEVLSVYLPTITATVGSFCSSWSNTMNLRRSCLSHSDLVNAGVVWATNFHHRYRRPDDADGTRRLLRHYIQQRLVHLLTLQASKTKHVTGFVTLDSRTMEAMDHGAIKALMEYADAGDDHHQRTADLQDRLKYMPTPEFQIRLQRAVEKNPELGWLATRYSKSLQRKLTNTIVE